MKWLKAWLSVGVLCFAVNGVYAQSDLGKGLQFGAGAFASIYIHEVGHAVTAKAMGATDIDIDIPRTGGKCIFCGEMKAKYPTPFTRLQNQMLYASGLLAQNLASEFVIRNRAAGQSAFGQGITSTNIASNVMHVYGYYFKYIGRDGWQGNDLDGYYQSGGNPHLLSVALLAYTAYSISRMRQKEMPLFGLSLKF